jgi:hypothetical protein
MKTIGNRASIALIDATRQHNARTENNAVTHSTSLNACLDLFFLAGASRRIQAEELVTLFVKARSENRDLAYRILFWARDCRGGAGEKRFFQIVSRHCNHHYHDEWCALSTCLEEYGSWKDYFVIHMPNNDTLSYLYNQLEESPTANLLAKWFPRSGSWFVAMHKFMKLTPKNLRKHLVNKTEVVESLICKKLFHYVNYATVPSIAMNKYRNVFMKHDHTRFEKFNKDVLDGKAKVNASTLHPHQLLQALLKGEDATAVEAQWQSLPNYMEGSTERILPVCDVSGSMEGLPMDVSIALGLYISERNEGIFKDAFITFSESPTMEYVTGDNLVDRSLSIHNATWGFNTNLQAVFALVLDSAQRESIPEEHMPTKILIISDMEFDEACDGQTNLENIRTRYRDAGYIMPEVIFWNVSGRAGNIPASVNDAKVGLISGCSPAILTAVLQGKVATPQELMLTAINAERYEPISRSLDLVPQYRTTDVQDSVTLSHTNE